MPRQENTMSTILQQLMDAIYGPPTTAAHALDEKATHHPDLHWRTSIVDLLKLVDQDSSLPARERLAKELGYTGKPATGEAAMNEFLHRKVLERLGVH